MRPALHLRAYVKRLRALAALAPGFVDGLINTAIAATMPLKRRVGPLARKTLAIRISSGGRRLRLQVASIGDLNAVCEVFATEIYDHPSLSGARTIVDLGSNIGASAVYFSTRSPGAEVVCVEPSPRALRLLRTNTASLQAVRIVEAAVGEYDGTAKLHEMPETQGSSLRRRSGGIGEAPVRLQTLDTVLDELEVERVDILKLDVEGSELEVLRGFSGLSRTGVVLAELHLDLMEGGLGEIEQLLDGFEVELHTGLPDRLHLVAANRRRGHSLPVGAAR